MDITFYSHGACQEVTGSKHFLQVDDTILQIDSGMFQGRRKESYEKNSKLLFDPSKVTSILLSHAHFDHSGALPIMTKNGFNGSIYATPATRDIANIIMMDSAHIQKKDFEYIAKKNKKYPKKNLDSYPPLYNAEDVIQTLNQFMTVNYHRPFFPAPNVTAMFQDAGHILGSSIIKITAGNGTTIGFSGDLGRKDLPLLKDPETFEDLDYLVLEGTYGNRLHDTMDKAKEELAKLVHEVYWKKGKIIIPAFTIERTQELIYFLHLLLKEKKIPEIPIFIDSPMAVNATSIFKIHPECFDKETFENFISENIDPFGFDQIKYISSTKDSIKINSHPGPAVIISASGMAENGRILHHLRNNIENPNNIVVIVGFMAQNTLGRKLVENYKEIKIFGKQYKVNADIKVINAFSAHADYSEIKVWLKESRLKTLKKIFLVHGETDALNHLKEELGSINISSEVVEQGLRYQLS